MARLLIPTRNRPTSLMSVIGFLERFYPGTRIIVADGSADGFAAENRANMEAGARGGLVEYRRYPYELPLFERILRVLRDIDDPTIIMGSDDDFPFMDVLERAERRLLAQPGAVSAMGAKLSFTMFGPAQVVAQIIIARTLGAPDVKARCAAFARWPFSTTYAVTRREVLIERFERAGTVFLTGFYDFGVGLHDAACGQVLALPEFCFAVTRNYTHSYLRADGNLNFVHRAGEVLKVRGFIVADLVTRGGLPQEEAEAMADEMLERKIVGGRFSNRRNFEKSGVYTKDQVQAQIALFENVFRPGTTERAAHRDRLAFIMEALSATSASRDNHGEDKKVDTLDRQMEAGRAAEVREAVPDQPYTRYWNSRRYRDPINLTRRVDPDRLVWIDDPGAQLDILALGDGFGEAAAEGALAASLGRETLWPHLARRFEGGTVWAELGVWHPSDVGGTIDQWGEDGTARAALERWLPRLAAREEPPQFILWHVAGGGADAPAQARYEKIFDAVHALLGTALPEASWLVFRTGAEGAPERAAQEAIIERYGNTLAGPDTFRAGETGDPARSADLVFDALRDPARAWQRAQSALVPPLRPRSGRSGGRKDHAAPGARRGKPPPADGPPD